jgi:hypothetical protein
MLPVIIQIVRDARAQDLPVEETLTRTYFSNAIVA